MHIVFTDSRQVIKENLIKFGFVNCEFGYEYEKEILKNQFTLKLFINDKNEMFSQLTDNDTGDEYVLHLMENASGQFVGDIKNEYESVINSVILSCFERDVFRSEQAKQIISYAKNKYAAECEFLWAKFPKNAVLRRADTNKWFALLGVLDYSKLNIDKDGKTEILNLRIPKEEVENTVDSRSFFPAYHMNKKSWYTICLDGSIKTQEILSRLDKSYSLALS